MMRPIKETPWQLQMNRNSFTNLYPVTSFLLLLNGGFFLLQYITPGEFHKVTIDLGANYGMRINGNGEYWRLISCTFLHGDILHLAMNCMVLLDLGRFCEPRLSKSKFFSIYILSAIGGSIASYTWGRGGGLDLLQDHSFVDWSSIMLGIKEATGSGSVAFENHLSVGCSTALAGLIGMMLVYSIKERHAALRAMLVRWILFIVVITLVLPSVDHAAHIGGLVVGGICGLSMEDYASSKTSLRWRIPAGLTGLAMVGALTMAIYHFGKAHWSWS